MTQENQTVEQSIDPKLVEFYQTLQVEMQHALHHVVLSVDPLVEEAGASLGDFAFCAGSTIASVLFELIRNPEDTVISGEQAGLCASMLEPFVAGFAEKLELLKSQDISRIQMVEGK